MRELTQTEMTIVSGGTDGPIYLDATGLNVHLVFGPVLTPLVKDLVALLGIQTSGTDAELRIHLGGPVTPAPITSV
jgi:hypothetical protein